MFSKDKIDNYIRIGNENILLYSKAITIISDKGLIEVCDNNLKNTIINVLTELDIPNNEMLKMLKMLNQVKENKIVNDNISKNSVEQDTIEKGNELIISCNDLIEFFDQLLNNCDNLNIGIEQYQNIFMSINKLKEYISDYNEGLEIYLDSDKTDDEAIKYFYDKINNLYNSLIEEKNEIQLKQQFLDASEEFYVPINKLKNVIVFIPVDDKDESNMEDSLNCDENIDSSDYNTVKLSLQRLMLGYEDSLPTHLAKSQHYSEQFLKEYHIKAIKASKCRIVISRYSTTLSQRYKELTENLGVIFVFSAGYGHLDGNAKHDLYEGGLAECYKNREQVDKIRELLNLDWSKLSNDETIQYDNEIKRIFKIQKKQMDHFLNTCIYKQNVSGKNK